MRGKKDKRQGSQSARRNRSDDLRDEVEMNPAPATMADADTKANDPADSQQENIRAVTPMQSFILSRLAQLPEITTIPGVSIKCVTPTPDSGGLQVEGEVAHSDHRSLVDQYKKLILLLDNEVKDIGLAIAGAEIEDDKLVADVRPTANAYRTRAWST